MRRTPPAALLPALLLATVLTACESEPTSVTGPRRGVEEERFDLRRLPSSGWTLVELPFAPAALNDAGVIVGRLNGEAVRWQNGALTVLPHKPGLAGPYQAIDISKSGLILGEANGHGLMWLIPSLEPTDISPEPFQPILPRAINDHFAVAGAYRGLLTGHVFRYTPTTGVRDITPDGALWGATITGLNDAGYASGFMTSFFGPTLVVAPVRWDPSGYATVMGSPATGGIAYAVNNNNIFAGWTSLGVTLWDLDSYYYHAAGVAHPNCLPTAISDAGRIIGYNCTDGPARSWTFHQGVFTWIDPPVPTSGVVLILVDVNTCGSFVGVPVGANAPRDRGYLWIRGNGIQATCDAPPVTTATP